MIDLKIDNEFLQFSPVALSWIEEQLKGIEEPKIIEFGAGVSTIVLAQTFPQAQIYAVEGHKEWLEKEEKWLKEREIKNVTLIFKEQDNNYRRPEVVNNMEYVKCADEFKPYDLILNDGAMREIVADYLLKDLDSYLKPNGVYLRHDYEQYLSGDWRGSHLDKEIRYEQFVLDNPGYSLVTIGGNGKWGSHAEYGGLWRRK